MSADLQGDWFSRNKRQDLRLIQRAIKEKWSIPKEVFETAPKVIQDILSSAEPATTKIRAIMAAVSMNGQNHAVIDSENKEPDQPGVSVTINQYANGGIIESQDEVDASCAWIETVASDASDSSGAGVVRDEGQVPSPPSLGSLEQEVS